MTVTTIVQMLAITSKIICISLPSEKISREGCYTPPFRSRGMSGNRLLTVTVYTVARWTSTMILYDFILPKSIFFAHISAISDTK